ncbi:uncharacterized protein [Callorhinus ursinus]|uniref:uncharacterized protein n=1 Tax=Callorhinus ursinus TaxID=34884 RepID=UPI003CD002A0
MVVLPQKLTQGSIPGPGDHDLSRRQTPNRRSHPGAPEPILRACCHAVLGGAPSSSFPGVSGTHLASPSSLRTPASPDLLLQAPRWVLGPRSGLQHWPLLLQLNLVIFSILEEIQPPQVPGPHRLRSERRLLLTAPASADQAHGESQLQDEIPGWVWLDINRPRLSPSEGWGTPGPSLRAASQVIWTQTPELRVCKSPVLWGGWLWTPRPPRSLDPAAGREASGARHTQPRFQSPPTPTQGPGLTFPACLGLGMDVKAGSRSQTKMLLARALSWPPWPLGPLTLPSEFGTWPRPWPPKPHSCWTTPSRSINVPKPRTPTSPHLLFPERRDFLAMLPGVTQHHSP